MTAISQICRAPTAAISGASGGSVQRRRHPRGSAETGAWAALGHNR